MLLLVIKAELHQGGGLLVLDLQVVKHRLIDMRAIRMHLMQTGARHQAARATIGMRAELLVIGIEKVLKALIVGLIPAYMLAEDESLKKPGGVRQMPFGRA